MTIGFQKAKREKIWVKVLIGGPSGSGKTYSALRLATGLAQMAGSRIAFIDTENGRARYYASEFDFDDMQLTAPFTPEKYIEAIEAAILAGYKVLIIDSSTHEWDYCLDVHSKMPGNSYTNWGKITPRHDAFMEKMLQSPIHIITTVRGKDEYVLEEKNGKQTPKKIGLGYKQRDNIEYNYTVTFNVDQNTHVADATKDNTHLFEGRYEVLTEKDGMALYDWANSGEAYAAPKTVVHLEVPDVTEVQAQIKEVVAEKTKAGVPKEKISEAIKSIANTANYNKINDIDTANAVLTALKNIAEE